MAFQVLVKTTPHMLGSYSYDLVSREAAEVFVQRSDVWWCFPVEEDTLDGGSWHRGGAWTAGDGDAAHERDREIAVSIPLEAYGDLTPVTQEEEDPDDRW